MQTTLPCVLKKKQEYLRIMQWRKKQGGNLPCFAEKPLKLEVFSRVYIWHECCVIIL